MSYYLKQIKLIDFLSYQETTIDLDPKVNVITGLNLDDHGQESNGSGKSSVIEGIYFALSGRSLRGVPAKKLIRQDQPHALVELTICGINEIIITREIFAKSSTSCQILSNDEIVPITSQDDATSWILSELNISGRDELLNSYIISRSNHEALCQAKESKKREIILRLANATEVDRFLEAAKTDLKNITVDLSVIDLSREKIKGSLEVANDNLQHHQQKLNDVELLLNQFNEHELISCNKEINEKNQEIAYIEKIINEKQITISNNENELNQINFLYGNLQNQSLKNKLFDSDDILETESLLLIIKEEFDLIQDQIKKLTNEKDNHKVNFENKRKNLTNQYENKKDNHKVNFENKRKNLTNQYEFDQKTIDLSILSNQLKTTKLVTCPKCNTKHLAGDNDPTIEKSLSDEFKNLHLDKENSIANFKLSILDLEENFKLSILDLEENFKLSILDLEENFKKESKTLSLSISEKSIKIQEITELKNETEILLKKLKFDLDQKNKDENEKNLIKLNELQQTKSKIESLIKSINKEINELERNILNIKNAIKDIKNKINSQQSRINDLINSSKENIKRSNLQVNDLSLNLNQINQQYEDKKTNQAKAKLWVDKFNEFKGWLCRRILNTLSALISDRLSRAGSDLSVYFEGFRTLATGLQKDEVTLTVLRDGLPIGGYESLSSGEKARVDLATLLAMLDLTTSGSHGFHVICLDEILDSVDLAGTRGLVEMLANTNYQIIMISQHELEGTPAKILKAIKKNKITTI